jgi:hypothetical protein
VFTHVLDSYGHLVGQRDSEPGGGAKITTLWNEGELVVDNYGLPILPGTPPGEYLVEIGLYGMNDGRRLPVVKDGEPAGDYVVLQSVRVLPALAPPPSSVLGLSKAMDARFSNVSLRGYSLSRLGYEHEPNAVIQPGDILHLTLFWEGGHEIQEQFVVLLRLEDPAGKTTVERRAQPTEGLYPSAQWRTGEIVRDQHNIALPSDLAAGLYRLTLSVQDLASSSQIGPKIVLSRLALR